MRQNIGHSSGAVIGKSICRRMKIMSYCHAMVHQNAGVPECRSARMPECRNAGVPECQKETKWS